MRDTKRFGKYITHNKERLITAAKDTVKINNKKKQRTQIQKDKKIKGKQFHERFIRMTREYNYRNTWTKRRTKIANDSCTEQYD